MSAPDLVPLNLSELAESLLEKAQAASARRAAHTVHGADTMLRQTALALLADAELAEHDSPPSATLQVLRGRILLRGKDRGWELSAGDLMPIPPERHSVQALDDSVFLLTVRREPPAA